MQFNPSELTLPNLAYATAYFVPCLPETGLHLDSYRFRILKLLTTASKLESAWFYATTMLMLLGAQSLPACPLSPPSNRRIHYALSYSHSRNYVMQEYGLPRIPIRIRNR